MHFLQLARRGLNVVLISRDLSKLKHEAKEIGEYRKGGSWETQPSWLKG